MATMVETQLELVPLDQVAENPWQPRTSTADEAAIEELAESIKGIGLQEYPAGRRGPSGDIVQLAYGHRRYRAYCLLAKKHQGYGEIPVFIREYTDEEMAFAGLEENRSRRNLTAIEEARAMKRIADEFSIGVVEIGARIGMSKSAVSHALNTLSLPEAVLTKGEALGLSLATLRELNCWMGKDHSHEDVMLFFLGEMERQGLATRDGLLALYDNIFMGHVPGEWGALQKSAYSQRSYERFDVDIAGFEKENKEHIHYLKGATPLICEGALPAWKAYVEGTEKEYQAEKKKASGRRPKVAKARSVVDIADTQATAAAEGAEKDPDDIRRIPCPTCHANAGAWCKRPSGHSGPMIAFHAARRNQAAAKAAVAESQAEVNEALGLTPVDEAVEAELETIGIEEDERQRIAEELDEERELAEDQEDFEAGKPTSKGEGKIDLAGLVPELLKAQGKKAGEPVMGRKVVPNDMDLAKQQEALATVTERLNKGTAVADIPKKLLTTALGTRAKVYDRYELGYSDHKTLDGSAQAEMVSPSECRKRCAWGYALASYGPEGTLTPVCVNVRCFNGKTRRKSRERGVEGKAGFLRDEGALPLVADYLAQQVTLPRNVSLLLLAIIGSNRISFYAGNSQVNPGRIFRKLLDVEDSGYYESGLSKKVGATLEAKSDEELRKLVVTMVLELTKSHDSGKEWEPRLRKALGTTAAALVYDGYKPEGEDDE